MYSDGRNALLCVRDFISDVRKHDYVCDNFVIRDRKIYGKDYRLNVTRVLTRREMIDKYPERWLAVFPFFKHPLRADDDCGVVCEVMTGAQYNDFYDRCCKNGNKTDYYYFHTTPRFQ